MKNVILRATVLTLGATMCLAAPAAAEPTAAEQPTEPPALAEPPAEPPAGPAQATSLVVNGDFEAFDGAVPDGWRIWQPAGTGSLTRIAGPDSASAAQLTTDTATSRLAVVQDITVAPGTYLLSYTRWLTGVQGNGQAGIRVNIQDGSGGMTFHGDRGTTDGWQRVSTLITVPADSSHVRLHLFNDGVAGTMRVDDVTLTPAPNTHLLTSSITPGGLLGLDWSFEGLETAPARYQIHRAAADSTLTVSGETQVRDLPASVTSATDPSAQPGLTYRYLVTAIDATGTEIARTIEVVQSAPADAIQTTSLAAIDLGQSVRLTWRGAAAAQLPLTLLTSDHLPSDGTLTEPATHASNLERQGTLEVPGGAAGYALQAADGTILATASPGRSSHPRLGIDADAIAKVQRLIAQPGTPQDAWQAIMARVEAGPADSGTEPGRYAREAAFVYQVTGEQRYADLAWQGMELTIAATPFQGAIELVTANQVGWVGLAYDWAYPAWNDAQRATALDFFERAAAFFERGTHPNLVLPDKASNWVGVVRGAELLSILATRGDLGRSYQDERLGQVLDQLRQHLDVSLTSDGWSQEGLDYVDYTAMIAYPGIYGSFDAGIDTLRASVANADVPGMLIRAIAARPDRGKLQWGVGPSGGAVTFPLYLRQASGTDAAALVELYERTQGHRAQNASYSPANIVYALLDWPEDTPAWDSSTVIPAMLDDEAGAYLFRNRIADADDVLAYLGNRNSHHIGWSGSETMGLSLISHDTVWATQPGKARDDASRYSRVMVDDVPRQQQGHGITLASTRFDGQGGGYVDLDGSGNLAVTTARRSAVVDLEPRAGTDAILAFSDTLADDTSHTWAWQLVPQAGVTITIEEHDGETWRSFLLTRGESWLRGWVLDADGATLTATDGRLRIERIGTDAQFQIVLATGTGTPVTAEVAGSTVRIAEAVLDLNTLKDYEPPIPAPVSLGAPSISGEPDVGQVMRASEGEWDRDDVTLGYQWFADGVAIPGAQRAEYQVDGRNAGQLLTVEVTATTARGGVAAVSTPAVVVRYPVQLRMHSRTVLLRSRPTWVYLRAESDGELAGTPVQVTIGGSTVEGVLDRRGRARVRVVVPRGWHRLEVATAATTELSAAVTSRWVYAWR